jgi:hypothetical protein
VLWGLDESDTKDAAVEIASSFLLRIDPQSGTMGLHDVLRNWLGRCLEYAPELHSRLIDAWPDESIFFRWNRETTTRQRKVLVEATDAAILRVTRFSERQSQLRPLCPLPIIASVMSNLCAKRALGMVF